MKAIRNIFSFIVLITIFTTLTSCNESVLGQNGSLNEAIVGHALPSGSALNTTIQAYLVDRSASRYGMVKLRPQWGDIDLNWFVTPIKIFVKPGSSAPFGKTISYDAQYKAYYYDDLAIVEYSSACWVNLSAALSNLTGSTTPGNRTFIDLIFEYVPSGVATTGYDSGTMYCNGTVIHYRIIDATVKKC